MTTHDYHHLVNQQKAFFNEHITREIPFRLCALDRLAEGIVTREKQLNEALHADMGKSPFESYVTEIGILLHEIRIAKNNLQSWARDRRRPTPLFLFGTKSRVHYEPYGCVLIIAPWNYPLQLALSPLVGAIAAGNCALIKPSGEAPHTAQALQELIGECFEEEYIAVADGRRETTEELLQERFDYIFYTGGVEYGRHIMQAAARHLTPVTLELGGKSPCIVDDDAHLPTAARRIVWGKFINCGQTCVAPDYLLVHSRVESRLIELMRREIVHLYGEDPQHNPDYSRIVNERHFERLAALLSHGTPLCGGTCDPADRYIAPTLLTDIDPQSPLLTDEIFGPILPVMPFDDIDDCVEYINQREKPLALYYFTRSRKRARYMIQHTSSGGACINDTVMQIANGHLPFGGIGNSGMGAYHGHTSFETFSHQRSVVTSNQRLYSEFRFPPYGNKLKWLKRILK